MGFGSALIGEAVDYAIYFFVQAGREGEARWRRTFWPTVRLGVLTSALGFGALLFSGFPGLSQLGLYALSGVITAALITRFVLPTSFCIYGFLRKTIAVGPTQGFFIEVCIIAIPLLLTQVWLVNNGEAHFGGTLPDTLLLMGLGLMTTSALVFFALSIKLLRYSTAGLLQYISPTLVFLTAVFVFGEPMDSWKLLSFVVLWIGLAIYSWSALRDERSRRREAETLV